MPVALLLIALFAGVTVMAVSVPTTIVIGAEVIMPDLPVTVAEPFPAPVTKPLGLTVITPAGGDAVHFTDAVMSFLLLSVSYVPIAWSWVVPPTMIDG